jgi:hypothetical protein
MNDVMPKRKYYMCSNCGFSPRNRSNWCDLGCGQDYNKMIEIKRLEFYHVTENDGGVEVPLNPVRGGMNCPECLGAGSIIYSSKLNDFGVCKLCKGTGRRNEVNKS